MPEQPATQGTRLLLHQGKPKSRGQARHQQEFAAVLPVAQARTFKASLAFAKSPGPFNVPTARRSENDFEGLFWRVHFFGGKPIPGAPAFALPRDHQKDGERQNQDV
jgi:hypothetical protein